MNCYNIAREAEAILIGTGKKLTDFDKSVRNKPFWGSLTSPIEIALSKQVQPIICIRSIGCRDSTFPQYDFTMKGLRQFSETATRFWVKFCEDQMLPPNEEKDQMLLKRITAPLSAVQEKTMVVNKQSAPISVEPP